MNSFKNVQKQSGMTDLNHDVDVLIALSFANRVGSLAKMTIEK